MQDSVEPDGAPGITNDNPASFNNLFSNDNNDPDRGDLDITTSESDSEHESDLEEIEPPRPVKRGGRHILPNEAPRSIGGAAHRRYQDRIDKLMNSRVTDSNDEEDEFAQTGSYADYRYDGPLKGSATKKVWTRQDALQCLNVEFWLCHPDHTAGEEPDFGCARADSTHPEYDLFLRIERLIHEYYDGIESGELDDEMADADTPMANHDKDASAPVGKGKEPTGSKRERTKGESNLVRKTKNRVRDAAKAYIQGGYGNSRGNKKWYTDYLPDQAELMLSRFVDPYGAVNGTIAGHLATMQRAWMLQIGGRPATGVSGNQARIDDNMSAVAANAAAKSITTSNEVTDLKANVTKLRDQLVKKVRQMDVEQKQLVKKVNRLHEESGTHQTELGNQAIRLLECENMKKSIKEFNKTISGIDVEIKRIVAAEVKKHLAAGQSAMTVRKPKPTPVLEGPTDRRTTPAPRNPASRSSLAARGGIAKSFPSGQSPAKPVKKRAAGTAKSADKSGGSKDGEINWEESFFDDE